jgi:hypothetical protein
VQVNSTVENIASKIKRQVDDLDRASGNEVTGLTVDGIPVDSYITRQAHWFLEDLKPSSLSTYWWDSKEAFLEH